MANYNTVLIVDDDPISRVVLEEFFRKRDTANILQAENGRQVVEMLNGPIGPIDLILCDIRMPEMDGIELLSHLKKVTYSGAVAIVSGAHESIADAAAKLAGLHQLNCLGLIRKPLSLGALETLFFPADQIAAQHTA